MNTEDLNEIVELHGKWLRSEAGGERASLWGANLCDANLRGADLRDAILCGANLCDANLWGANLCDANLRGANLCDANLRGVNLRDANLCGANLWGANLWGASLWGANLCDANLRGSNLWGANLWGANLWGCTGNSKQIKSLFVSEVYQVTYTDKYLQIGCQRHEIAEWWEFNNAAIEKMDGQKALDFWTEWRDLIKTIIEKSPALPSGVEI